MKHLHKLKPRRREVVLQRIQIPADVRRDIILENDQTYLTNLSALCHRINSGKVDRSLYWRHQPNLAMAALRRAGLNLRESTQLVNCGR